MIVRWSGGQVKVRGRSGEGQVKVRWRSGEVKNLLRVKSQKYSELDIGGRETCHYSCFWHHGSLCLHPLFLLFSSFLLGVKQHNNVCHKYCCHHPCSKNVVKKPSQMAWLGTESLISVHTRATYECVLPRYCECRSCSTAVRPNGI